VVDLDHHGCPAQCGCLGICFHYTARRWRFPIASEEELEELAAMSPEAFWKQESRYINQSLHRLMGKKRFLLLDGEIIVVAELNRRQRKPA
jgi:hypothetical protein